MKQRAALHRSNAQGRAGTHLVALHERGLAHAAIAHEHKLELRNSRRLHSGSRAMLRTRNTMTKKRSGGARKSQAQRTARRSGGNAGQEWSPNVSASQRHTRHFRRLCRPGRATQGSERDETRLPLCSAVHPLRAPFLVRVVFDHERGLGSRDPFFWACDPSEE